MKKIKNLLMSLFLFFVCMNIWGQEKRVIAGKVLSDQKTPVVNAIVSASHSIYTDDNGAFKLELKEDDSYISVWAPRYYQSSQLINGRDQVIIVLVSEKQVGRSESVVLPFRVEHFKNVYSSSKNIAKKDFSLGSMSIDRTLSGKVAGLKMTRNGGMPGEGSYMRLRGVRTFIGNNAPLIVINDIPYLPDPRESQLINGYTRNIFQAYNIMDIQNITVLKGAEASMYGSMGSNGVILIETDGAASEDLETKISFYGQYGINWNKKRMPLLEGNDYKSYLSDIGMTYYGTMGEFFDNFPFLNNPNNKYQYLYNNNTDWQDIIYRNSFTTDNLFRVEGGDAIAKYDLSLGYMKDEGVMEETDFQRFHTQLNTNMLISKKVEMFATVGLAYMKGSYQEQGMINQTNPILAAYAQAPLLSPYKKDLNGNILADYASYFYGNNENMDFATSNPLALLRTLDARNRQYDVSVKAGLKYKPLPQLTLSGTVGIYYNYNKEHLFVPGVTEQSILPFFDQYGESQNTVKEGIGETFNWFFNLNGRYNKTFNNVHALNILAGAQVVMNKDEYDAGVGRNTPNDFYQTLSDVQSIGRYFYGYLEKWNWMNFYAHADYTYNEMVAASLNMAVDASSSSGTYGKRFFAYPSAAITWIGKGWLPLSNSTFFNQLNLRAEYGLTGNSRYSSNYGKYYYRSLPYQSISGIVRANIPNTKLKPEKHAQLNIGLDASLFFNRVQITADYYNGQTSNVILPRTLSSAFGTGSYYDNCAKLENKGFELSVQATVLRLPYFEWILGGNIAWNKNKVKSLDGEEQIKISYEDGAQLVSKVGAAPYQFYGYQVEGIFATQVDADAANLLNNKGNRFNAGDVHYVDQNGDNRIDDKDRVVLGDASPKYFGGFFTQFDYKGFSLSAEFTYSKGNKAYNAVRRNIESVATFGNQSKSVVNRWNLEGQNTNMPKANWGDPIGNSNFSSRWIEDASFIRMKNITLSYSFEKKFLNFFRAGVLYMTGENLFTGTKYLGLDPEFSFSNNDAIQGFDYAKLMQPKTIKFGVNLKF